MQAWTASELREYAPRGRDGYIGALVDGWGEITNAGINTPLRLCWFIAQWHHETGGFSRDIVESLHYTTARRLCEVWPERFGSPRNPVNLTNPLTLACLKNEARLADRVYGGRMGNCDAGDGFKYRGRGFNQLTGRDNYRRLGAAVGQPLEDNPDLAEIPAISLRIAIAEWTACDCNRFADRNNGRAIGNAINRGNAFSSKAPINAADRQESFDRAWLMWGDADMPAVVGIDLGDHGVAVENVQRRLAELNYPVGRADGIYGPAMRRAVAAFKSDWQHAGKGDIEPGTLVGDRTLAAIGRAGPAPVAAERSDATVADLAAAGSTTVAVAQQQQKAGQIITAAGAVVAAGASGAADVAKETVAPALPAMDLDKLAIVVKTQAAVEPAMASAKWCFTNFWWVAPIVLGVWLWSGGAKVIAERLRKHQSGIDLSR